MKRRAETLIQNEPKEFKADPDTGPSLDILNERKTDVWLVHKPRKVSMQELIQKFPFTTEGLVELGQTQFEITQQPKMKGAVLLLQSFSPSGKKLFQKTRSKIKGVVSLTTPLPQQQRRKAVPFVVESEISPKLILRQRYRPFGSRSDAKMKRRHTRRNQSEARGQK